MSTPTDNMVYTTETAQAVRDAQVIVPDWMEKVFTEAEAQGRKVDVARLVTPFGTYVTGLAVSDEPDAPQAQTFTVTAYGTKRFAFVSSEPREFSGPAEMLHAAAQAFLAALTAQASDPESRYYGEVFTGEYSVCVSE